MNLREKKGLLWRQIAESFPGRSQEAVESHYHSELKEKNEPLGSQWTPEEDQLLAELRSNKSLSWSQIIEFFPGRTADAVKKRWFSKLRGNGVSSSRQWTPEEDQLLTELREKKSLSWKQIIEFFPGRTPGAVQKHYQLRAKEMLEQPKETHERSWGQWTPEEDQLLVELKEKKGLTMRQIVESFPGRSAEAVERHYYTQLKGKTP